MEPRRMLLSFPDGEREWRLPPDVPDVGATITRRGEDWLVETVETDHDGVTIVVLQHVVDRQHV